MVDYLYLKDSLHTFRQNYNFLKIFSIGKSILNNEIYCIKFGIGKKEVLYTAGIHATEWITSLLLIKFAQICVMLLFLIRKSMGMMQNIYMKIALYT